MTETNLTEELFHIANSLMDSILAKGLSPAATAAAVIHAAAILAAGGITIGAVVDAKRRPGEGVIAMEDRVCGPFRDLIEEIDGILGGIAVREWTGRH